MRPKVMAAILGLILTIGGVGGLALGVLRMSALPNGGDCVGDECLTQPWVLALPLGIVAMVFGLIIASWAIGSLRAERDSTSPLRAFGFMTGLGAVFLVMGVIFLGGARGVGDDAALAFVGGLFGVMGLAFIAVDVWRFRGELRKVRLRASGVKGTAKVVDVRDTGVTVNNNPMVNFDLEVTLPGQSPFRTHKRAVISRLSVGALMPGATIPVLADPNRPKDIVLDWEAGVSGPSATDATAPSFNAWFPQGAAFAGMGGAVNAQLLRSVSEALARAADRAERGSGGGVQTPGAVQTPGGVTIVNGGTTMTVNGQPVPVDQVPEALAGLPGILAAESPEMPSVPSIGVSGPLEPITPPAGDDALPGRISLDTITDTGVDVGGDRLYTFDLTVSIAGRAPYQVKHAAVVPKALVVRLIRGASFPARIDPSQPNQLAIAWDR